MVERVGRAKGKAKKGEKESESREQAESRVCGARRDRVWSG